MVLIRKIRPILQNQNPIPESPAAIEKWRRRWRQYRSPEPKHETL